MSRDEEYIEELEVTQGRLQSRLHRAQKERDALKAERDAMLDLLGEVIADPHSTLTLGLLERIQDALAGKAGSGAG